MEGASRLQNTPIPCSTQREAASGTAGAGGAAIAKAKATGGPSSDQQGPTAETVCWQLQGVISRAVWRGLERFGRAGRGLACLEGDRGETEGHCGGVWRDIGFSAVGLTGWLRETLGRERLSARLKF